MAAIASYADILKQVIREYAAIKPSYGEIQVETIFDDAQGHYELMYAGWHGSRRIHGAVIHADIRDGKVWIQHDGTEQASPASSSRPASPRSTSCSPWHVLASTTMLADRIRAHDEEPREDHVVLLRNATWSDYQRVLEMRGDRPVPRLAYLEGVLQLTSPSQDHEAIKSLIGRLVEVWCLEHDIEFSVFGSWTLESEEAERGVEPDECYVFGDPSGVQRPHLAIEVIWTSGGLDKREIYRKLGVAELWFWKRGRIVMYVLHGETYAESMVSSVLPGIDLVELVGYLDRPTASRAIRDYRAALQARPRR